MSPRGLIGAVTVLGRPSHTVLCCQGWVRLGRARRGVNRESTPWETHPVLFNSSILEKKINKTPT